jgi:formamidopyrimidine-DNA glycosylase
MAEGDTILRAARRLEAALAGAVLTARAPNPRGRAAGIERLDGRRLLAVRSHGKNLLLECDGLTLHSHLGMNGSWHTYPAGARWAKPARSAWAVLETPAGTQAVQFGGSTLRLLTPEEARRDPQLSRLGPDVLAPDFDLPRRSPCCAPSPAASSATPCSTRGWSPGSATSSRASPAGGGGSTPGARSGSATRPSSRPSCSRPAS